MAHQDPNARLCKAMLDRLTDRAHIIETGTESYRFRRTMARKAERHEEQAVVLRALRWAVMVEGKEGCGSGKRQSTSSPAKMIRPPSSKPCRSDAWVRTSTPKAAGK